MPVDLSSADERTLLSHDKQILAVLAEHDPSTTGEIVSHLDMDSAVDASDKQITVIDDDTYQSGDVWPSVGLLARFPETEEYVFVLNVSSTHDRLQGIRTARLSEKTCVQIAAAGEPSQLERVADAVRLMVEGPHCSGDADAYEPVPRKPLVNPESLMTDESVV